MGERASTPPTAAKLQSQRRLFLIAGCVYLTWWLVVHLLFPQAYNPLPGRLLVVACFFAALAVSYRNGLAARRLDKIFVACAWLLTLHYYYLVYRNDGDMAWAIGAYVVVFAVAACLPSRQSLLAYSLLTLVLGVALALVERQLLQTIFLPGLATMTLLSNLTLHNRLLLEQERAERDHSEAARLMAENGVMLRDEFISTAAHELRTPLTSLQLSVQGALRSFQRGEAPADLERSLQICDRQSSRLVQLVERLLDASRMSDVPLALELEQVPLLELVRDVARMLTADAQRSGSPIEIAGDPAVAGRWDRLRLEQVVSNLLRNAINYGRARPIQVTAGREGDEARIVVQDQGIGIAPEQLDRIFGRFERAVPSRNYGGMGLGLYIARRIVDAHGGRISVASTPGEGATFTVHLPLG
ncbi:MAG TPA: HAMP domain-containing sensor histidine kinase [Myxococcales bacterium]|nr:HAMP domain-containing sensor histidine kinase [Myxococcales bacterium]